MLVPVSTDSSIKYVSKIFRKANISNPLIRTRTCAYQGIRNVSFRKILRTYLMDGPHIGGVNLMKAYFLLMPQFSNFLVVVEVNVYFLIIAISWNDDIPEAVVLRCLVV